MNWAEPRAHLAERARRAARRLPVIGWMWLLWVLMWGRISGPVLVGGLLVAVAVALFFPLPSLLPHLRLRPGHLAHLLGHLALDVVTSAVTVAWETVRHGPRARTAVVEVPLRVDTDFLVATTAGLTTLSPGTLVVEIDREHRLLYVHALPVRDRSAAEELRREVQDVERRVSRALGPPGSEREREPRESNRQNGKEDRP